MDNQDVKSVSKRQAKIDDYETVLNNPDSLTDELVNRPWGNAPPHLAKVLIDEYMNEQGDFDILSPQENQVLRLYTAGRSLGQIAFELKITKSSANIYLKRAGSKFRKLLKPLEGQI